MKGAIEVDNVTRRFGSIVAIDQVSLSIARGSCFGLIGPNGAGKTTLFSMLCGFLKPTHGRLEILGKNPSESGVLKGVVGCLPQDAALPAHWKVGELLTYWARLSGLGAPAEEARRALDCVNLPEAWALDTGALSHGMAKRVGLAQALLGSPPVLCLDEPTAGLDPRNAAQLRNLIRQMKERHTVVLSSHNLAELEELCDATAILDRGRLLASGSLDALRAINDEFSVQLASGPVPLEKIRQLPGCLSATLHNQKLTVRFDARQVSPEGMVSQTLQMLLGEGAQVLGVTRGNTLEKTVLSMT